MSKLLSAYKSVKQLHDTLYPALQQIRQIVPTHATTKNIADAALMLRKMSELLDDTRKECDKLAGLVSQVGCMMLVTKGTGEPLAGEYATAYGKVSTAAKLPSFSQEPEAYKRLCEILNVPYHPLTRLHWPAIRDAISEHLSNGGTLYPELQPYVQYNETKLIAAERAGGLLDQHAAQIEGLI